MQLAVDKISIESTFGITIQNNLIHHQPYSDKLMILFPGRGYTNDRPVLHYVRKVALLRGYDVLSLKYGFHLTQGGISAEQLPLIYQESEQAVRQALQLNNYTEICIVGKSMGTPYAGMLSQALSNYQLSTILLTPISNAVDMVKEGIPTLAVIGTADAAYNADKINNTETITWKVYDDLDHSLELENNWQESLNALQAITQACDSFLATL